MNNKWYSVGSVTVAKNSTTVNGKETNWLEGDIKPGDVFLLNNSFLEISQVKSSTEIILSRPYTGTAVEGAYYEIIQRAQQVLAVDIAYNLEKLINNWNSFVTTFKDKFIELKTAVQVIKKAGLYIDEGGDLAQDPEHGGEDFGPDDDTATDEEVNEAISNILNP